MLVLFTSKCDEYRVPAKMFSEPHDPLIKLAPSFPQVSFFVLQRVDDA